MSTNVATQRVKTTSLSLSAEARRWLRREAAERDTSMSAIAEEIVRRAAGVTGKDGHRAGAQT